MFLKYPLRQAKFKVVKTYRQMNRVCKMKISKKGFNFGREHKRTY